MVKRLILFCLIFPVVLIACPKDELLAQISYHFEQDNYEECAEYAKMWGELFPEDESYSKACFSIFLLAQSRIDEFISLADSLSSQLEVSVAPELQSAYYQLISLVKEEKRHQVLGRMKLERCSFLSNECSRGWKIKCFLGAVGYTAGLFIVPFNPGLGFSIISTAGGFILDGALGRAF